MTAEANPLLGLKLVPQARGEALCFVCTVDRPFLLSKVAGNFTIHDISIEEAEIQVVDGLANDLYRLTIPTKQNPKELESILYRSLSDILTGRTNLEREVYLWETDHGVIRDSITPQFRSVDGAQAVLSVITHNQMGLLHKMSWALSLAGVTIDRALFAALGEAQGEDIFWITQRHGQPITPEYEAHILELLKLIVSEGQDPIEQSFRKELNMIYRQQLRRRGGGFTTAQLYANAHLRLIKELFNRVADELNLGGQPLLLGVYGGIGSGAIGFTSDIDLVFLYDGPWREEYGHLHRILVKRLKIISGLDVDDTFLQYHVNYLYLNKAEGEAAISYDDLFGYINYIREMREQLGGRLFMPQFFHFPWAFSVRWIGSPAAQEAFAARVGALDHDKPRRYSNIKTYIIGEMGPQIARDYQAYLRGDLFRDEIAFLDNTALRKLHRKRAYPKFIEEIRPYQAIKYIFRRGVFPLLHILHGRRNRTDMGLLRREYRRIRPALDFMLKAFNVRKTLYITGVWDLNYFIYIMNCSTERRFCELYLRHQQAIINFVKQQTHRRLPKED